MTGFHEHNIIMLCSHYYFPSPLCQHMPHLSPPLNTLLYYLYFFLLDYCIYETPTWGAFLIPINSTILTVYTVQFNSDSKSSELG